MTKTGRKRKGKPKLKQEKGATYKTTYALVKEGMDLAEIADGRGMALSTIEGHVVRGIKEGELNASDVLKEKTIAVIREAFHEKKSLGAVYNYLGKQFSYDKLRMVQAELEREE